MNWQHFRAFLWLRWRIRVNQLRKAGIANVVVLAILAPFVVLLPIVMMVGLFVAGLFLGGFFDTPAIPATVVMFAWDSLVVGFLFCWGIGLITELQRSEVLSLDKFLHLPVSLKGVFLINYLSSFFSLTLLVFVPAMIGLWLGLVVGQGLAMLLLLPLVIAFFLMVTAVTYQFQGWLASLMVNKRRRRTIIVFLTMGFVLLCQLPNLVNLLHLRDSHKPDEFAVRHSAAHVELEKARMEEKIDDKEYGIRREKLIQEEQQHREQKQASDELVWRQVQEIGWYVNLALPIGWLPLGAMGAAEGNVVPALLGTLGLALIGMVCLRRSYKTTLRLYTGQYTAGKDQKAVAQPVRSVPSSKAAPGREWEGARFLEKQIPWVSERSSAIALSALRSLLRAPEGKMMLLSPLIMIVIFGSMFLVNTMNPPESLRPFMAFGAMAMVLMGMVNLLGNQFGFDRSGFRVFVLCAAQRREILLGKNLAFAPLALGLSAIMVLLVEIIYPMRWDHFLAILPQMLTVYLLFCLMANCLAIIAPMPISSGSVKPANPKLVPILLQMLFIFLMPLAMLPAMLLLAAELALEALEWSGGVPIWLILSPLECAAVIWLYGKVLNWQGLWLQSREQRILEVVTTKTE